LSQTSFSTNTTITFSANFNNSFSSVTNYPVTLANSNGTITVSVNTYTLSGGLAGGQYTIVLAVTFPSGPGITLNFNGTGIATGARFNYVSIITGNVSSGIRYIVLTFATPDGTTFYLSGSNFA
jgi:hypothetical protein